MNIAELRKARPELAGLDDETVVKAVHLDYPEVPIEKIAADLGVKMAGPPPPARTVGGTIADTGLSLLKGAIAIPQAAVGLADIATGGHVGKALDGVFRPQEASQYLDTLYSPAQQAANAKVQNAEGFLPTLDAAVRNPSTIYHSVLESVPSMAAGGLVGRGLGMGARGVAAEAGGMGPVLEGPLARAAGSTDAAARIGGAAGEGLTMAGQDAEQIRNENPDKLLTGQQAAIAGTIGAVGGALALVGAGVAAKLGIKDVDTMIAAGKVSPAASKGIVRSVLEGAVAEGVLEELPQSIMEQVLQNMATGKPLEEGVDHAAVLGMLAGAAMGGGAQMLHAKPAGPLSKAAATAGAAAAGVPGAPQSAPGADLQDAVKTATAAEQATRPEPVIPGFPAPEAVDPKAQRDQQAYDEATATPVEPEVQDAKAHAQQQAAIDAAAHEAATSPHNDLPEPTDKQKEAGNYKKGHVTVHGLDMTVENPQGSERSGKRPDGSTWNHTMSNHYGYFKRTVGADEEQVDAYLGPRPDATEVYVVDQVNQKDGSFDEHKVMMGFATRGAAVNAYKSNFDKGWKVGGVTAMPIDEFKTWLKEGDTRKPVAKALAAKSAPQAAPTEDDRLAAKRAAYQAFKDAGAPEDVVAGRVTKIQEQANAAGTPMTLWRGPSGQTGVVPASQPSPLKDGVAVATIHPEGAPDASTKPAPAPDAGGINVEGAAAAVVPASTPAPGAGSGDGVAGSDARGVDAAKPADAVPGRAGEAGGADGRTLDIHGRETGERHEALTLPYPGRPNGVPLADITVYKMADGTFAAGRGFMVNKGGEGGGAGGRTRHPTRDKAVKEAVDYLRDKVTKFDHGGQDLEAADRKRIADILAWLDKQDPAGPAPAKGKSIQERRAEGKKPAAAPPEPVADAMKPDAENLMPQDAKNAEDLTQAQALSHLEAGGTIVNHAGTEFEESTRLENNEKQKTWTVKRKTATGSSTIGPVGPDKQWGWGRGDAAARALQGMVTLKDAKAETPAPKKPEVSANTVFTEDAAAKARARMKAKLGRLQSGIDPELLQDGITLAGYHVEKGARTFAAYAQAMLADLGEEIRPYLKQFYMALKYDPRAIEGMDGAAAVDAVDVAAIGAEAPTSEVEKTITPPAAGPEIVEHTTGKGKVLRGVVRTDLTLAQAKAIDAFTFKKDGGFFIREKYLTEQAPAAETPAADAKGMVDFLAGEIAANRMPKDNPALKRLIQDREGVEPTPERMKQAQEQLEAAIVQTARGIVAKKEGPRTTFDILLRLYQSQPLLNVRTSSSIDNQAYSTPAPLAFLASELAGIQKGQSVLEPTAGTGMLLMNATIAKADVNELDPFRAELLQAQGFRVSQSDATELKRHAGYPVDAVITNPPFGGLDKKVKVDGYNIGQIDHLIAAKALATMKADGRAVLILGANKIAGALSNDDLVFFNWLYSHYDVRTHFEVDGKLYTRQGASWPVRVIAIAGRKESAAVAPPEGSITRVNTWEQVYEQYTNGLDAFGQAPVADKADGAVRGGDGATATRPVSVPAGEQAAGAGRRGSDSGKAGAGTVPGASPGAVGNRGAKPAVGVGIATDQQRGNGAVAGNDRLEPDGNAGDGSRAAGTVGHRGTAGVTASNEFQTQYIARSARKDEGVLIPVNMAQPTQEALDRLEDEVGDIDEYAAKELGYDSTKALHDAFMGLQVDSVASAIFQLKRGKGTIIADQTGIGKGRQAAAIIRWAAKQGKVPVFVTVKPSLFTDMHGDLHDIGSDDIRPLIMNLDENIKGDGDEILFGNKPATHKANLRAMAAGEGLPDGRNALFMTYSQINKENVQRDALRALADNAVIILDESHNAGGESQTGDYIKSILDLAQGTVYLSATFAKRPDNMPLYYKTDIGEAVADDDTLMNAMAAGGLPLQTVVSNNLVKAGQMFRRERSYDGVNIRTVTDTDRREEHEELSDRTTTALRAIVDADRLFHAVFIAQWQRQVKDAGERGLDIAGNQATKGVDHTQFSSVVHNFVRQMLLGLSAQKAADGAIAALKAGQKPLIALENTMGSFLADYAENTGKKPGDALGQFDYRTVLSRALDRTRFAVLVDARGNKNRINISLDELDGMTRQAYQQAQDIIDDLDLGDIPVSPLDWIRQEITKAGYSVAEITGRNLTVDYSDPKKPMLSTLDAKEQKDKVRTSRLFNSGELDAIILNVSGSTGISLHASEKFTDQRQRKMIVAQAAQDINIFMQMLGRVHRTGQVALPEYDILNVDLPAVRRPVALLSGKMKSLNANTSSNTESATSVKALDMLNKYGDEVVAQYLDDNKELSRALGIEAPVNEEGKPSEDDIARKATGRLALMPVATQKLFYEEVEAQYSAMIDYLNKTNQNELEPRTFDYDAKELKTSLIFEGTNPKTPFGQSATYGEYSIKAQGKAMTPAEIQAEIAEHLAGKTGDQHSAAIHQKLSSDFVTFAKTIPADQAQQAEHAAKVRTDGARFLEEHAIGTMFRVDINGDQFNAVVTNIKNTHKKGGNPFALSKFQVTIAVNGALRHVTVPATKFASIEISRIPTYQRIDGLFREQAEGRALAKIVTGNLLGAYGQLQGTRGTIIAFTKADGNTEQGILLPQNFSIADNTRGDYRIPNGAAAVQFLQQSENKNIGMLGISTRDNVVRVLPARGGGVTIMVPKSKASGGKYFLDEKLRAVTGDFVSVGNRMTVNVPTNKAPEALDIIMKKQALYALPSMAEDAKRILGGSAFAQEGGERRFGRQGKNMGVPKLQALADSIADAWENKPQMVALASVFADGVPPKVQADARARMANGSRSPKAVFFQGTVYLFEDSLHSMADAVEYIYHEALGHYGMRGKFGRDLDRELDAIVRTREADVIRMLTDRMRVKDTPANRVRAAEEVVAYLAQRTPNLDVVQRVIAAIRNFLREHIPGFRNLTMTDRDIIQKFIIPSRQFVQGKQSQQQDRGMPDTAPAFGEQSAPFYSALDRGIAALPDTSLRAIGWQSALNSLVNKGKAKADEIEWSGLREWLELQEGRISKDAVRAFLAKNGVQVTETIQGGTDAMSELNDLNVKADALGYSFDRNSFNDDDYSTYGRQVIFLRRHDQAIFQYDEGDNWIELDKDGSGVPLDEDAELSRPPEAELLRIAKAIHTLSQQEADDIDQDGTQYSQYTLPGGENYRELLLTLPEYKVEGDPYHVVRDKLLKPALARVMPGVLAENAMRRYIQGQRDAEAMQGEGYIAKMRAAGEGEVVDKYIASFEVNKAIEAARKNVYQSNHWQSTPNVLAHIRMNERTDADGKRVLFVEEIQSDWAQQGKKRGLRTGKERSLGDIGFDMAEVKHELAERTGHDFRDEAWAKHPGLKERYDALAKEQKALTDSLPNAPFVGKTDAWVALALKRIVKYAVDNGMDRVAFIDGQQSADRYGLNQVATEVEVHQRTDGRTGKSAGKAVLITTSRGVLNLGVNVDGVVDNVRGPVAGDHLEGKHLSDVIGEEMAAKVMAVADRATFKGEDLRVGGKGMMAFYDKIIPAATNKLLAKIGGGKVAPMNVTTETQTDNLSEYERGRMQMLQLREPPLSRFAQQELDRIIARQEATAMQPHTPQLGFDITPAMKEAASEGLPMFSQRPGFTFNAEKSPLFKKRTAAQAKAVAEDDAMEALSGDATARRIMAKGIEVQDGELVGARLNINVFKSTGVAVNTIHRGTKGEGYKSNRGLWGGEVISYLPVVTLKDAYFNVSQPVREKIASGQQPKAPMASVDGKFVAGDDHNFDGVEFRFNPKREHLFRDGLGRVLRRADEVTVSGNSVFARGEIEYYGAEDVPARAGEAATQGKLLEPGDDSGEPMFAQDDRTVEVDGKRRFDTDSKGQRIHPTFQGTVNFWRWFGDSKVEDGSGRPQVVYHGTLDDVSAFEAGEELGGIYFTRDADYANQYADQGSLETTPGGNVIPAYLSISNPMEVTADAYWKAIHANKEAGIVKRAKKAGHDGIVVRDFMDNLGAADMWVAFKPSQIKSAIGNSGQFDAGSDDIMFGQDAPTAGLNDPRDFWKAATGLYEEALHSPGKLNWWQKTFGTPYDLAQRHPQYKAVFDRVQEFLRDVSLYATEAADAAPRILPKLDGFRDLLPKALGGSGKRPMSPEETKAVQAPIFEGTLMYGRDQDGRIVPMKDLEERYKDMDGDAKGKMLLSRGKVTEAHLKRLMALPFEAHEGAVNGLFDRHFLSPGVVWTVPELKSRYHLSDSEIGLYQQALKGINASLTNLIVSDMLRFAGKDAAPIADAVMETKNLTEASEMLRDYLLSLEPTGSKRSGILTDTAAKIVDKANLGRELMKRGYAPLSRFGTHVVDVVDVDGERVYFGLFEDRMSARRMAAKMAADYPGATIKRGTTSQEEYKLFAGMTPETAELFGEMLGLESDGKGAGNEAFQTFLKKTKANRSAMKRHIERKGIAGFSEDVGRVLAGFIYSNARQTSQNLHARDISEKALAIDQGKGELKDAAIKLMQYVQNPSEEALGLRGVLFAQYLGGSVASMLVNMTQPYAVTMPYLSQFGGIKKAGATMAQATADVMKKSTGDDTLDAALKLAEERGIVAPQEVHQIMAQAAGKGGLKSGDGTMVGNTLARANNGLSRLVLAWGKPFAVAELFNRRITFIAAYRTAVAQGIKDPAAFAEKAIQETQFVYNKGNKPQWGRGAVGSVLFTFKQYSISYLELVHRMYTEGGPEGKKAALFMLAMLMLAGGAGGLPFVEDVSDLVDGVGQRMGYNIRTKHWRQELLKSTFGEGLGSFMDKGVSGLPGVPIDVAGRFGMGNLIPGTGLLTMKADHTQDVTEILGPSGDFATRLFHGANELAAGNVLKASQTVSPTASRNVAKAFEMATLGYYTDSKGKKVIDTDGYDAFAKAMGFQPSAVAKVQEATRDVQQLAGVARIKESEIADKWAAGVFKSDSAAAQSARDELAEWNANNPDSPIRIQPSQIRKRVQEMRKPKEQRVAEAAPREIRKAVKAELAEARK